MKKILISAGPTRESIDPVRFLSNRSTGKMGYALAAAAVKAGFAATLVSGPVALKPPEGLAEFISVTTAAEMAEAMKRNAGNADIIIMCAAVADFRPVAEAEHKIKKTGNRMILELEPTEDILMSLGKVKKPDQTLIGFAAETDDLEQYALGKLKRKNLDWIAANRIGVPGEGFGAETNAVILYSAKGQRIALPLDSKSALAEKIIATVSGK